MPEEAAVLVRDHGVDEIRVEGVERAEVRVGARQIARHQAIVRQVDRRGERLIEAGEPERGVCGIERQDVRDDVGVEVDRVGLGEIEIEAQRVVERPTQSHLLERPEQRRRNALGDVAGRNGLGIERDLEVRAARRQRAAERERNAADRDAAPRRERDTTRLAHAGEPRVEIDGQGVADRLMLARHRELDAAGDVTVAPAVEQGRVRRRGREQHRAGARDRRAPAARDQGEVGDRDPGRVALVAARRREHDVTQREPRQIARAAHEPAHPPLRHAAEPGNAVVFLVALAEDVEVERVGGRRRAGRRHDVCPRHTDRGDARSHHEQRPWREPHVDRVGARDLLTVRVAHGQLADHDVGRERPAQRAPVEVQVPALGDRAQSSADERRNDHLGDEERDGERRDRDRCDAR
jgi:hypothetical protein